jgi:excinuclease ABC subunit C
VRFPINSPALYFFQRIRDEAHRFAITYHRKLRGQKATQSVLDEIKGLSEKNKELLIKNFKTINKISKAEIAELATVINKKTAKIVYDFFNPNLKTK